MPTAAKTPTRRYRSIDDLTDIYSGGNQRSSSSPRSYRSLDDLIAGRSAQQTQRTPQPKYIQTKQKAPSGQRRQHRAMFDVLSDPDSAARFRAAKLSQTETKPHGTIEEIVKSAEHIWDDTLATPSGSSSATSVPSGEKTSPIPPKKRPVSPYIGVVEANRNLIIKDGKEAFASLSNGLRQYNEAARQFTASIRALQSGLSVRGKALLKRDIEELQGFKQVVQDTLRNFSIKMPVAK